ncbi:ribonuclease P protein component [Parvibacter caecicola]|uniref:ribonuclease P protein component n=1 Tax=Parvibacter caecicola TaxID=747645 RepID=UPI003C6E50E8
MVALFWPHAVPRVASVCVCKTGSSLETIKSSNDISSLFECGKRFKSPYITFIVSARESSTEEEPFTHGPQGRVAFIAGKKLGNAVWRNRAKRRMRAICCDLGGPWPGSDIVFLAKSAVTRETYSKVLTTCGKTLSRAGFSVEIEAE